MVSSFFRANAFVAPDSAPAHLAPRQSCNLVFKKVARRAHLSLEFPIAIQQPAQGPDDQRAIILVYDADILKPGEQSCRSIATPFLLQPQQHAAIARNNSAGKIKHLALTIRGTCCKVFIPRYLEKTKPDPEFVALYDRVAILAKQIKIHILFDINHLHKNDRSDFMQFVQHPDKSLVHVSCKEGPLQVDPFSPCKYATLNPPAYTVTSDLQPDHNDGPQYSSTDEATTVASPSIPVPPTTAQPDHICEPRYSPTEEDTTVATPSTPPPYTSAPNGQPRHNHGLQYLPTNRATTVAYPSTQSPCINASNTRARQATKNSPSKFSSTSASLFKADVKRSVSGYSPDTYAPTLHEIVMNAINSRFPELLREVLPDMLQRAFEAASPPDSNPKLLNSSLKDSIRAVCSEEVAVILEDKVDDITRNWDTYAEDYQGILEEQLREHFENVISSIQEDSISELRKVVKRMVRSTEAAGQRMVRRINATGKHAEKEVEKRYDEVVGRLEHREAAEQVFFSNITPRKRVRDELSAPGSSKRLAPADHLQGEVGRVTHAHNGTSASAVQKVDYQSDAIVYFTEHFAALDVQLQLAVIEAFEVEFVAKTFVLVTLELKKAWVQRQLERCRDSLCGADVNLDLLLNDIEWDKEGDVTRKVVEHVG